MHIKTQTTFKLNPTNGLSKQVGRALLPRESGTTYLGQQFGSFLRYILDRIETYPFTLVRSNSFSLVNVSTSVGQSFGYSEIAFKKQSSLPRNILCLTFCIAPLATRKVVQGHTLDLIGNDFLFGPDSRNLNYLTITIDQATARGYGIDFHIGKQLEFIYNNVGMVTKSFVQNPRGWWESKVYSTSFLRTLHQQYFEKQPTILFKDIPIGYWHYNKKIWQEYQHLIVPKLIDQSFFKYFTVFILDLIHIEQDLGEEALAWIYGKTDSLRSLVERGIRTILLGLNGKSIEADDSVYCAAHLLYRFTDEQGIGLDDDLLHLVLGRIQDKQKDPEISSLTKKLFGKPDIAATKLIDHDIAFQQLSQLIFNTPFKEM